MKNPNIYLVQKRFLSTFVLSLALVIGCDKTSENPEVVTTPGKDQPEAFRGQEGDDLKRGQTDDLSWAPFDSSSSHQDDMGQKPAGKGADSIVPIGDLKGPAPEAPKVDSKDPKIGDPKAPDLIVSGDQGQTTDTDTPDEVDPKSGQEVDGDDGTEEDDTGDEVDDQIQAEAFQVPQDPNPDADPPVILDSSGRPIGNMTAKINTFGDTMAFLYEETSLDQNFWNPQYAKTPTCIYEADIEACAALTTTAPVYEFKMTLKKRPLNPGLIAQESNEFLRVPSASFAVSDEPVTTSILPATDGSHADFLLLASCYGTPSIVEETKGDQDIIVLANDSDIYKRTINYNSFDDINDFLALPELFEGHAAGTLAQEADQDAARSLLDHFTSDGMTVSGKDGVTAKTSIFTKIMTTFICKAGASGRECSQIQ